MIEKCIRQNTNSPVPSSFLRNLANDNIRRLADPFLFKKLLQGQILYRAQVAYGEVGVVGSVVGKRFLGDVQDFGPFCAEITLESILQFLRCNIFGNCKPNLVEVANGNQPARDDSPGFIKIDRQGRHCTPHNAGSETGKNFPIHRSKNDKGVPRSNIKYPRQAAAAERH
ncbi:MAG: hypothetical protein JRF34_11475 [Deltaproteobacteria bacterium]|nr:hypothetical protein [Deltaproteobacteria bacterium]